MVVQSGAKRASIKVVPANTLIGKSFFNPSIWSHILSAWMFQLQPNEKQVFSKQVIANSYNYRKKGYSKEEARKKAEELAFKRLSMEYKKPNKLSLRECQFIGFWLGDGTISRRKNVDIAVYGLSRHRGRGGGHFQGVRITLHKSITPKNGNMQKRCC